MKGSGLKARSLRLRYEGFLVQGLRFNFQSLGFKVQGLRVGGFRV